METVIADAGPLVPELQPDCRVFTLDSDFRIYRRHRRQTIPLLCPE